MPRPNIEPGHPIVVSDDDGATWRPAMLISARGHGLALIVPPDDVLALDEFQPPSHQKAWSPPRIPVASLGGFLWRPLYAVDGTDEESMHRLTGVLVNEGAGKNDANYWRDVQSAVQALTPAPVDPVIEEACRVMHDAYEAAAAPLGWATQEASRKPWEQVPAANRNTMRAAVEALRVHWGVSGAADSPTGETSEVDTSVRRICASAAPGKTVTFGSDPPPMDHVGDVWVRGIDEYSIVIETDGVAGALTFRWAPAEIVDGHWVQRDVA